MSFLAVRFRYSFFFFFFFFLNHCFWSSRSIRVEVFQTRLELFAQERPGVSFAAGTNATPLAIPEEIVQNGKHCN